MLDDFRLRVFETLCRTLSFTAAARELGISQPAISLNIAELEKQLGVTLFDRAGGRVSLSEKGEIFRQYSSQILHWYDAANKAFSEDIESPAKITLEGGRTVQIWSFGDDIHLKLKDD